jgi:hypothetical protein
MLGFNTEVVARGVPVGVAVTNVLVVALTAVSVSTTPVAVVGTPPTPPTCTVIEESGPTGATDGTPIGSRVSRIRAGSTVITDDGDDGAAVDAVWTPMTTVASAARVAIRAARRRTPVAGMLRRVKFIAGR